MSFFPRLLPTLFIAGVGFFLSGAILKADSISITPMVDTSLSETFPNNNFGGNGNFISGTGANGLRNRALLQFDITGNIPTGATITSASLELSLVTTSAGPGSTFELRRILQSWGEGTKTNNSGALATSGEASWNARFFPGTLWAAPGAASPTDVSTTASASQFVSGVGHYQFGSSVAIVTDLQDWLDNSSTNFGWLLISQSESTVQTSRRFGSREAGLNAPTLTITYAVPEPGTLGLFILGGLFGFSQLLSRKLCKK